jgi:MtN3 and saliva related transmembrane protein
MGRPTDAVWPPVRDPGPMSIVQFLATTGTAFGLVGATSLLLQARRLRRLGTACEISIPIRLVSLTGYAVWLAYGIVIRDLPLIVVDLAGLAGAGIVLHITLGLRSRRACPVL